MRSPSLLTITLLLLAAAAFCGGNLWFAAARSTIPLALEGVVRNKELRREKHPGVDDVYLLHLDRSGAIPVDRSVFDHVQPGDLLRKPRWSRQLQAGNRYVPLSWSDDSRGMLVAMPVAWAVIGLSLGAIAWQMRRPTRESQSRAS